VPLPIIGSQGIRSPIPSRNPDLWAKTTSEKSSEGRVLRGEAEQYDCILNNNDRKFLTETVQFAYC
jgi:hypothetical protein